MKTIVTMIRDFNNFKHAQEEVHLPISYDEEEFGELICTIHCDQIEDDHNTNIHYEYNHFGSEQFCDWLNRWNLSMKWLDKGIVGIYER